MARHSIENDINIDPEAQVQQGNSWFVSEQFREQLGRPGTRALIEQRWKYFEEIVLDYLGRRAAVVPQNSFEPLRYLDAGCGDGINLQWASSFFRGNDFEIKVTALDYNSLRVDRVRQKQLTSDVHVASLLEMPFNDESFDMLLCNHVLEHIDKYMEALGEIGRSLKLGGLLVVGVPNEGCLLANLRNKFFQRTLLKTSDHVNFFTESSLGEALCASGFKIVRVYRGGFFLPHFWFHYALTYFRFGEKLLSVMGRILPSQSAELIVYAVKV